MIGKFHNKVLRDLERINSVLISSSLPRFRYVFTLEIHLCGCLSREVVQFSILSISTFYLAANNVLD